MSNDWSAHAATLTAALHLRQPAVAIAFADEVPAGVPMWKGQVPAGCRFWEEGSRALFATVPVDHDLCAIGTWTHNLETSPAHDAERAEALKVFASLGYVRPEDLPQIPVLRQRPKLVIYGPLDRMPIRPAVVLLFARPEQALILSEASQQTEAGTPPAMGRPACAVVPQAANSQRTALSLGCCGARAYLDVLKSDVALYAIPESRLAAFTARVAELAKANEVLTAFHAVRRRDVERGLTPTIAESLAAMQS
ncbi:MAG TPA: DUF169 domain-containing protein [Candidatus Polarisedimenticolia bacterium]|jgi:hypothetical protein|nr:DUF169 domain-containing protein [Candidatus Polarisedimenticolia bacterium]